MNIDRRRQGFERKWTFRLVGSLIKQAQPVIDELGSSRPEEVLERIGQLIKDTEIRDSFKRLYPEVGVHFARNSYEGIRPKSLKQLYDDIWMEEMISYAERRAGGRIVSITATKIELAKRILRDLMLTETIEQGMGIEQIARMFQRRFAEEFGKYDLWQARRIAQTEVLTASNYGSHLGAAEAGAQVKVWLTSGIVNKDIRHVAYPGLHNQQRAMNEFYDVGGYKAMYPGDTILPASEVINCKCIEYYKML